MCKMINKLYANFNLKNCGLSSFLCTHPLMSLVVRKIVDEHIFLFVLVCTRMMQA